MTENSSLPLDTLSEQLQLTLHSPSRAPLPVFQDLSDRADAQMMGSETIARLKAAILAAQSLGELHALMEVYSYEEFMQVYNQLTRKQQAKVDAICDRDTQRQMAALNSDRVLDANVA